MVFQVQALNEVSALSPFPPQFASINFTTSQSGTRKADVCWDYPQYVCAANCLLSVSMSSCVCHYVYSSSTPVFPLPLPTACLSIHLSPVHNFSSSALWTQVALGHDMLSFHIMVKKATRETERDEEWREDNQCGSPQKLWKQKAQFIPLSLSLLSLVVIQAQMDSADLYMTSLHNFTII